MRQSSLSVFAAVAAIPSVALAADLFVPQDFASIQAAIDAAVDGDRVLVAPGTYVGSIDFLGKSIVVESVAGAESTILDGEGQPGFVVLVNGGADAVFRGFTVTGGFGQPGSMGAGPGGGMRIHDASALVDACVFSVNTGIFGGGVSVESGAVTVLDSIFEANYALRGGAIDVQQGSATVERTTFTENMASNDGGAVSILWLADATLRDLTFFANSSNALGGALYTNFADIDAARLTFEGNGLATPMEHPNGQVNGLIFSTLGGGAVYSTATSGRFDASRFVGNTSFAGSAIYVAGGSASLQFVNCLVTGNVGGLGSVYFNSSSPSLINCTIVDNDGFGLFTTFNSFPIVANSIVAGHDSVAATEISGNGQVILKSSLVQGSTFNVDADGTTILGAAPLLDENFVPLPGSPAVDAGDNALLPVDVVADLLGNDRFVDVLGNGAIVDIGAIELPAASSDDTGQGTAGSPIGTHGDGPMVQTRTSTSRPTLSQPSMRP